MQAAVSLSDLKHIRVGDQVKLISNDPEGSRTGKISRISEAIDDASQSVGLFIAVRGENLKERMFPEGKIGIGENSEELIAETPRDIVNRNNQVYVVEDSIVRLAPVLPERYSSQTIWVKGLKNGQMVVGKPVDEPLKGTKVTTSIQ